VSEANPREATPAQEPGGWPDAALARLAAAHGVAIAYEDANHQPVRIAAPTVVSVLGALGVDASTPDAVARALAEAEELPWRRLLPPTVVGHPGEALRVHVHLPHASDPRPELVVHTEGGGRRTDLSWLAVAETREVDGQRVQRLRVDLPGDLPLGEHRLVATAGELHAQATVLIAPRTLELPAGLRRAWGWMLQLYSVRSAASWGIGDYADLADIARWSGSPDGGGAGLVLCNPLHAFTPVPPVQNSPYFPSSRRFRSPLYLRVADTAEYAAADPQLRREIDGLRPAAAPDRIDRDRIWAAQLAALQLLAPLARTAGRRQALAAYRDSQGEGLTDFALHCALAQRHGPNWQQWPEQVRDPRGPAARAAAEELSEQLEFWCWVQLLCDEQLAAAAAAAAEVGMPIGVVHDLAVGVDPHGADAWALQDVLAIGATVGAPPDLLNQLGQNWGLPPWHPRQLAETGYAPFRDMVRSVLRHSGGIRIDHVMGLFRLWWVPTGSTADRGSYVSYDAQAMLAVLLLEAHRAGAVVVGEDLGTVEPAVTKALAGAGILGSAVAWFENDPDDERRPLPPARWRELAMASVTTHDLPTVAGWYTGDSVRLRAELGQLSRSAEEEQRERADERAALLDALRAEGLLAAGGTGVAAGTPSGAAPPVEDVSLALHRLLVRTPSRLVLAAFGDAVGDLRQPNLPGTLDEYPNWRLPVADAEGRPLTLEQLREHPGVRRLIEVLRQV